MSDLAQLGFEIDTAPLKRASTELEKLVKVTELAEKGFKTATSNLKSSLDKFANDLTSVTNKIGLGINNVLDRALGLDATSVSARNVKINNVVNQIATLASASSAKMSGPNLLDKIIGLDPASITQRNQAINKLLGQLQAIAYAGKLNVGSGLTANVLGLNPNSINAINNNLNTLLTRMGQIAQAGNQPGIANIANRINAAGAAANTTSGHINTMTRGFGVLQSQSLSLSSALLRTEGFFQAIATVLAGRWLVEANIKLQSINAALLTVTGNSGSAGREFEFVSKQSDRLGLDLATAAKGYSQLLAASKDTAFSQEDIRKIFISVSEASRTLGLSVADTDGVLRALTQIMSKNSLQAEELRGQLGDRIPGAVNIMAKALGVTTAELTKMTSQGQVTDQVLRKGLLGFATELSDIASKGLPASINSVQSELNRLSNSALKAAGELGEGGFNQAIINVTKSIRDYLDAATNVGAIKELGNATKFLSENLGSLAALFIGASGLPALLTLATGGFAALTAGVGVLATLGIVGALGGISLAVSALAKESITTADKIDELNKKMVDGKYRETSADMELVNKSLKEAVDTINSLDENKAKIFFRVVGGGGPEVGGFGEFGDLSQFGPNAPRLQSYTPQGVAVEKIRNTLTATQGLIDRGANVKTEEISEAIKNLISLQNSLDNEIQKDSKTLEGYGFLKTKQTEALKQEIKLYGELSSALGDYYLQLAKIRGERSGDEKGDARNDTYASILAAFKKLDDDTTKENMTPQERKVENVKKELQRMSDEFYKSINSLNQLTDAEKDNLTQEFEKKKAERLQSVQDKVKDNDKAINDYFDNEKNKLERSILKIIEAKDAYTEYYENIKKNDRTLDDSQAKELANLSTLLDSLKKVNDANKKLLSDRQQANDASLGSDEARLVELLHQRDETTSSLVDAQNRLNESVEKGTLTAEKYKEVQEFINKGNETLLLSEQEITAAVEKNAQIREKALLNLKKQVSDASARVEVSRLSIDGSEESLDIIAKIRIEKEKQNIEEEKTIKLLELENRLRALYRELNKAIDRDTINRLQDEIDSVTNQKTITESMYNRLSTLKETDIIQERINDKIEKSRQLFEGPMRSAVDGINNAFTDMFETIFNGGEAKFSDLANVIKRIFIKLAAELVTVMAVKPIIGEVLTSLGGAGFATRLGYPAGTSLSGSVQSSIGGTGILGGLLGGGVKVTPTSEVGSPALLGTAGYTGASTSNGDFLSSLFTPGSSGLLTTGAGIAGGLAGNFLSSTFGLGGGQNSQLLGTLGSLGGGLLGSTFGPVGAFAGSALGGLLGNVVGGLFGGSKGMSTQEYYARIAKNQQDNEIEAARNQKIASFDVPLIQRANLAAQGNQVSSVGQQLQDIESQRASWMAEAGNLRYDQGSIDSVMHAYDQLRDSIKNDFLKSIKDATLALTDPGGEIKRNLDKAAKDLRQSAKDAGVGIQEVETLITEQMKKAVADFNNSTKTSLAALTGDPLPAYNNLLKQQEERVQTAIALGADLVEAEKLNALERINYMKQISDAQKLLLEPSLSDLDKNLLDIAKTATSGSESLVNSANALRDFKASLEDFVDALQQSDLSPYAAGTKYQLASAKFSETAAAAAHGDTTAIARFQSDAQAFLAASKEMFATSETYQADFQKVLDASNQLKDSSSDMALTLDQAALKYNDLVATGTGALLDGVVRDSEAAPIISAIDTLHDQLVDLVGPTNDSVLTLEKLKTSLQDTAVATEKQIKLQEAATPPATPGTPGSPTNPAIPTVNGPLGALTADQINALPGWQQAAYNGGPSQGFLSGLANAVQPGASYSTASPAIQSAIQQIFAGNPLDYIKFGSSATDTLLNSNLYSYKDIYDKYGVWPFQSTESQIGLMLAMSGDQGGVGLGVDNSPQGLPGAQGLPQSPEAVNSNLSPSQVAAVQNNPSLPSLPGVTPAVQAELINRVSILDRMLGKTASPTSIGQALKDLKDITDLMDQEQVDQQTASQNPSSYMGVRPSGTLNPPTPPALSPFNPLKDKWGYTISTAFQDSLSKAIQGLKDITDLMDQEQKDQQQASQDPTGAGMGMGASGLGGVGPEGNNSPDGSSGHAGGGWIWGRGTRVSDSIRYGSSRVSSGEYIINAEDAAENSDLVQAINGTRSPINVKISVPGYEHLCDLMQEMVSELSLTRKEVVEKLSEQNSLIRANTKAINSVEYGAG